MSPKEYWSKSHVAVLGSGMFGTVLANLVADRVQDVVLYARDEEDAREMSALRENAKYWPGFRLHPNIRVVSELTRVFDRELQGVLWVLPSRAARKVAREVAPFLRGEEIVLHAAKGMEANTHLRISEVLLQELPILRIGVLSGANLAKEMAQEKLVSSVIATEYSEVYEAAECWFSRPWYQIERSRDLIGVEWLGSLKNIVAVLAGLMDAMGWGSNGKAVLLTKGLREIVKYYVSLGGDVDSALGPAGMGDLFATCSSLLSRNYQVGFAMGKGQALQDIVAHLGSVAEGIATLEGFSLPSSTFAARRFPLLDLAIQCVRCSESAEKSEEERIFAMSELVQNWAHQK